MQTPADPKDTRTASNQTIHSTALEIQHDRGVIYVYNRDGSPLLKITGLPRPIPHACADLPGSEQQLTIEVLVNGANCEWRSLPGNHPAAEGRAAGSTPNAEPKSILKQARATLVGSPSEAD